MAPLAYLIGCERVTCISPFEDLMFDAEQRRILRRPTSPLLSNRAKREKRAPEVRVGPADGSRDVPFVGSNAPEASAHPTDALRCPWRLARVHLRRRRGHDVVRATPRSDRHPRLPGRGLTHRFRLPNHSSHRTQVCEVRRRQDVVKRPEAVGCGASAPHLRGDVRPACPGLSLCCLCPTPCVWER